MAEPQLSVEPNPRVPLRIVYEEPDFLVVDKPAGLVVQPGEKHTRDTLLNALFATHGKALQNLGKPRDFGLIHRIDRPTSGLVVVGLTPAGYDGIRRQFEGRKVRKVYLAGVHGGLNPPDGVERTPIREVRLGGRKQAVVGPGRGAQPAVTRYHTVTRVRGVSLLECSIETGRLHQIRAHLAHRGCPVIGDREYGPRDALDGAFRKAAGKSICLHAAELGFGHPVTGRPITVRAPLPAEIVRFFLGLGLAVPRKWRG